MVREKHATCKVGAANLVTANNLCIEDMLCCMKTVVMGSRPF